MFPTGLSYKLNVSSELFTGSSLTVYAYSVRLQCCIEILYGQFCLLYRMRYFLRRSNVQELGLLRIQAHPLYHTLLCRRFLSSFNQITFVSKDFDGVLDCISIAITCAFNKRGTLLAVGCNDGRIVLWDFLTRGIAKLINAHVHPVCSLRYE